MKITRTLFGVELSRLKDVRGIMQSLELAWEKLAGAFNGRVSFGDGNHLQSDNIDGVWISFVTGVANTDQTLNHNLNRIPSGYIAMQKSAACDLYTGSVVATKTQITLRPTVAGVTILLFVV